MPKAYDLTNQRFGKLVAQYKCNYKKGNKYPWHCICDCGNEVDVRTQDLTSGKTTSCGCLQKEIVRQIGKKTSQINFKHEYKDITNQRFGFLVALKRLENKGLGKWLCQCDCGNMTIVRINDLTSGNTTSCGCIRSKGQLKISQLLNQYNIPFETEKSFETSYYKNTKNFFRFDFYVNNEYIIEYDGIQHFKENNFFPISLREQQMRDQEKNEWCKNNNIPLIRIPYKQFDKITIQDLLLVTSGFIIK